MFNFFKKKEEPENLKELLSQFSSLKGQFDKVSRELENLKIESNFSIQKVGIVRFNPFKEVGGNQSFSLALLDGSDSGIVITSLYSRTENRFYGKTITKGQSDYSLSQEEKEAIQIAKKRMSSNGNQKKENFSEKDEKNNKRKFGPEKSRQGGTYGAGNSAARSGGFGAH